MLDGEQGAQSERPVIEESGENLAHRAAAVGRGGGTPCWRQIRGLAHQTRWQVEVWTNVFFAADKSSFLTPDSWLAAACRAAPTPQRPMPYWSARCSRDQTPSNAEPENGLLRRSRHPLVLRSRTRLGSQLSQVPDTVRHCDADFKADSVRLVEEIGKPIARVAGVGDGPGSPQRPRRPVSSRCTPCRCGGPRA